MLELTHCITVKDGFMKKIILLTSLLLSFNLFASPEAMDHLKEGLSQMLNVNINHKVSLNGKSGIALNHNCNVEVDLDKMQLNYNDSRSSMTSISIDLNSINGEKGEIAQIYPEIEHFTVRAVKKVKIPFLGSVNNYDTISIQRDVYDSKAISITVIKQKGMEVQRRVCNFTIN